jgi:RNA polymerase sigma factor (sigma-70 family)
VTSDRAPIPLEQLLADGAWLERLALRLARHGDDARDAVQDTWVAALRSPPDRNRPPGPWLASVLRHLVHRQRRQRRRRQVREYQATAFAPQTTEPASDLLEQVELHRTLTDLVLELEEPFRSTVLRRFFEGSSGAEIARASGVPEGTVRWRLSEALRRLREGLDERQTVGAGRRLALLPWKEAIGVKLSTKVALGAVALLIAGGTSMFAIRSAVQESRPTVGEGAGHQVSRAGTAANGPVQPRTSREAGGPARSASVPRFRAPAGTTEVQVAAAEAPPVTADRPVPVIPLDRRHDFTPDELDKLAANCEVRVDIPGIHTVGDVPMEWMDERRLSAIALRDGELPLVREVLRSYRDAQNQVVRDWYAAISGRHDLARDLDYLDFSDVDHPAIQRLSAHITAHQISEGARIVALELAGKRRGDEKPADAAIAATAALYRRQLALADRFEVTLTERLGAERARFLRRGPLAGRTRRAGCM